MKLLFTLLLATTSLVASAQKAERLTFAALPVAIANKQPISPAVLSQISDSEAQARIESIKRERDFYEKMYTQAKETAAGAHADLLATLSVEFGVIGLVVAILIGGQLFANNKINRQLLATFEERINNTVNTANAALQISVNEKISSYVTQAANNEVTLSSLIEYVGIIPQFIEIENKYNQEKYDEALRLYLSNIMKVEKSMLHESVFWILIKLLYKNQELPVVLYEKVIKVVEKFKDMLHSGHQVGFYLSTGSLKIYNLNENSQKEYVEKPQYKW